MRDRIIGYVFLALAMMTVGSTVVASRAIAGDLPPFLAAALRFAIALPFFVFIVRMLGADWPKLSRREWLLLGVQAGAGSVGYTTLLIAGLSHMPATDAGVLIGTLPAVSALFSVMVLGERPQGRLLASVGLATAGVLAVTGLRSGGGSWLGAGLILGAVFCECTFILLNKRMAEPLPPLLQATAMTAFGLVISAPFAAVDLDEAVWSESAIVAVAWYALVPTVAGFLLWYAGAARVSGTEAAIFTAVAPLTAVVGAALFLDEAIGPPQVMGMVAIIAAIALLSVPATKGSLSR